MSEAFRLLLEGSKFFEAELLHEKVRHNSLELVGIQLRRKNEPILRFKALEGSRECDAPLCFAVASLCRDAINHAVDGELYLQQR
jgi:hypothetical protein